MTGELPTPQKASEWIVLLSDRPEDVALHRSFQLWLEQDALHREDWEEVSRTWHLLGLMEPSLAAKLSSQEKWTSKKREAPTAYATSCAGTSKHDRSGRSRVKPVPFLSGAKGQRQRIKRGAFVILLLCMAFFAPQIKHLGADYRSGSAEVRVLDLADGSRVTLAPESAINVDLSARERQVTIVSGTAYFEVSKDKAKPFVVSKEGLRTTVIGTAFLVEEQDRAVSVSVAEGAVLVETLSGDNDFQLYRSRKLKPGQSVQVRHNQEMKLSSRRIEDIALWRKGYLSVRDRPLGAVVKELDRFYEGYIFVENSSIRDKRLTGVFKLDNPHKSLEGIAGLMGLEVTEISPWFILLSKK